MSIPKFRSGGCFRTLFLCLYAATFAFVIATMIDAAMRGLATCQIERPAQCPGAGR